MKKSQFIPEKLKLRVGRSRTGLGLFTEEPIKKGTCVIEYVGEPVPVAEQYTRKSKYLFETGKNTMIDGASRSNTARYINHSCRPNCEIKIYKRRVFVMAKRNIKTGEELTYDYDTEYFEEFIKPHGCKCLKCLPE